MIHSPERVKAIRDDIAAYTQSVANLEARVKDPYIRERLQQVRDWLQDAERFFLGNLLHESRSAAQESVWLEKAEMFLQIAVVPHLKVVQDAVAKYGPNITTVG